MADAFRVTECRGCHAPIIWAITVNGKKMPVDVAPSNAGTVRLTARGKMPPRAEVFGVAAAFGKTGLRVEHHATCPHADLWRSRKGGRR